MYNESPNDYQNKYPWVITKDVDLFDWWTQIMMAFEMKRIVENQEKVRDTKVFARFVGILLFAMHAYPGPLTKTRMTEELVYNLINRVGIANNILLWNKEQLGLLENRTDDKIIKKELLNQIYAYPEKKVIVVADIGFSENYLIF